MPVGDLKQAPESATADAAPTTVTRLLSGAVLAGIALYVLLDIVAQVLPPHYSPIRQPESDLAVGPYGWIMTVNFVVRGLFSLALVAALASVLRPSIRTAAGLILLLVWAVAAFVLAVFPTDIVNAEHTLHGKVHLAVAAAAFLAVTAGEIVISFSFASHWKRPALRWLPAWVTAGTFLLLIVTLPVHRVGGLTERLFLAAAILWMLLTAWNLGWGDSRRRHVVRMSGQAQHNA